MMALGVMQRTLASLALTPAAGRGYAEFVTGVPVIGFDSSNSRRTAAIPVGKSAFFTSVVRYCSYGRGRAGSLAGCNAARLAGTYCRSVNPFGSVHPFDRGLAEFTPISRSLTMDTHTPGASAPVQAIQPAIFQFHSVEVRTIDRDGQVWFVASDVAKALGYADAIHLTRVLDADEAALHNVEIRSENGTVQTREVTILSESGLYHALLKSRKPEAKPFRKWVTTEVLPAIRRSGSFVSAGGQIPADLQKTRFLLTVYPDGRSEVISLPPGAAILSVKNKTSMSTLMREFIPGELLPELMRIGLERISKLVGQGGQNEHPRSGDDGDQS